MQKNNELLSCTLCVCNLPITRRRYTIQCTEQIKCQPAGVSPWISGQRVKLARPRFKPRSRHFSSKMNVHKPSCHDNTSTRSLIKYTKYLIKVLYFWKIIESNGIVMCEFYLNIKVMIERKNTCKYSFWHGILSTFPRGTELSFPNQDEFITQYGI